MAVPKGRDLFRKLMRGREELFLALVDAAPEAIIVVDEHMHIIFWNKGAEAIYGYTEDEIVGENAVMLLPEQKRASEQFQFDECRMAATSQKLGKTFASVGVRKSGEEIYLSFFLATGSFKG